jgi:hypothetical protein
LFKEIDHGEKSSWIFIGTKEFKAEKLKAMKKVYLKNFKNGKFLMVILYNIKK